MKVTESICTNCGHRLDGARGVNGEDYTPRDGDMTICLYCSHLMAYDYDLQLRNLTEAEVKQVAGDQRILRAMKVVKAVRK